jgi:hypothetical protein
MPLTVVSLCTYLTRGPWGPDDHTALKFIKALKGTPFNGYADFPVNGRKVRLLSGQQARAAVCFGKVAGRYLASEGYCEHETLRLVPIPSSDGVNGEEFTRFPALLMAKALAAVLEEFSLEGVAVADILRWATPKTASHEGGSRNPHLLYQNLLVTEEVDSDAAYVLVDDVCTLGSHMRASTLCLEEAGASVAWGVCAGRSAQVSPERPLAIITETVEDLAVPKRR